MGCSLAVVGAGWAGAYFAWRAAIETSAFDASEVCVFEAEGRVGGRIYSVRDLPSLTGLALDVGGYRFIETDGLPTDLIQRGLRLPSRCYDAGCAKNCPGYGLGNHTCYVVNDAYGNNAGYATPVERMLEELINAGAKIVFGARLTRVDSRNGSVILEFQRVNASSFRVEAQTTLLNLPRNAVAALKGTWLDPATPLAREAVLDDVDNVNITKIYASYDDAWWISKLGIVEGDFATTTTKAPLAGRYHDGPLKCVTGRDANGRPIFADSKVPFGECSGALEVYYSKTDPFWAPFANSGKGEDPLAVYFDGDVIDVVHEALMAYHSTALAEAGVEVATLAKPRLVAVANWIAADTLAPGCGNFTADAKARRRARNPVENVYMANSDYGPQFCWATGALTLAEKILSEPPFSLPKPTWLRQEWYQHNVIDLV